MSWRRSISGTVVAFVLGLSAFTATSASAEQRAYTCEQTAVGFTFGDAHCVTPGGTPSFGFKHTLLTSATSFTVSNSHTAASTTAAQATTFRGTLAGHEVKIDCTTATGTGSLTNGFASVSGTGSINYSGCTATVPSPCTVVGSKVVTKELKTTTLGQAANTIKLEPVVQPQFASVALENCFGIPNATYPMSGTIVASVSGATLTTTHAEITAQNKLMMGGVAMGIEGALTISKTSGNAITLT